MALAKCSQCEANVATWSLKDGACLGCRKPESVVVSQPFRKWLSEPATAVVTWFNDSKGFGYCRTDKHPEVFIHYTSINGDGFKTLAEGQEIECIVIDGPKGPQATNIRKVIK